MDNLLIERTASTYNYPLLIKNLLDCTVVNAPTQEIVYRDQLRFDYRTLRERICRLNRHALRLKVKIVEEIDKTSVGKIDKKLLREKYLS